MTMEWDGAREDAQAAVRAAVEHDELVAGAVGEPMRIANEFSEIVIRRVDTRNGARVLIESPRSGQWLTLCPVELEALTWQNTSTFSAMVGNPFGPLVADGDEAAGQ